jgi:hypothetical protein
MEIAAPNFKSSGEEKEQVSLSVEVFQLILVSETGNRKQRSFTEEFSVSWEL